jgi:hypothetical protein
MSACTRSGDRKLCRLTPSCHVMQSLPTRPLTSMNTGGLARGHGEIQKEDDKDRHRTFKRVKQLGKQGADSLPAFLYV